MNVPKYTDETDKICRFFKKTIDKFQIYGIILFALVSYMVDVAQLVRVPGCGPGGRRFDPDHPPHFTFEFQINYSTVFYKNIFLVLSKDIIC